MDNNIIGYSVTIKCRKCSKRNEKQLFIFNNKNMIDFNSNTYNCCNNQINFAAFYSDTRLDSINKINQQNNLNMNMGINNLNMNNFDMNNEPTYIRSNSDTLLMNMNNFNNQNMNNINQNNNNFNRGFSGNVQNTYFNINLNNNQINNNNNNNFQNNNLNLMKGNNKNQNIINMNNQNSRYINNNMIPNNQFNNNMNNFQNNNYMYNNMNNNLNLSQSMNGNNTFSVVGQNPNNWNDYINDNPGYFGQQITFKFEFKQQYNYMTATNKRIFKDVLSEFLNGHPEISSLLNFNQRYLFNGDVIDINKSLFELGIKNDSVVIINWVDNN